MLPAAVKQQLIDKSGEPQVILGDLEGEAVVVGLVDRLLAHIAPPKIGTGIFPHGLCVHAEVSQTAQAAFLRSTRTMASSGAGRHSARPWCLDRAHRSPCSRFQAKVSACPPCPIPSTSSCARRSPWSGSPSTDS